MNKILFFDGVCVMCNGLVGFVLRHDKKQIFKFATLQGATAEKYLPALYRLELKTIILFDGDALYTESDAIIRLLIDLQGPFKYAKILYIFPKFFRDSIYRIVAKNRYLWFGTAESCALLSTEERKRILD